MISIIVPIYNAENWLERCLESLINQTYKDIEIILVNDGSIDKSLEICRQYEKRDNRIVLIDKENEGVSATRNLGIKTAKGDFIQFVDSDDYIEKDMCQKMLLAIENADLVLCGLRVWQNGQVLREPHIETSSYDLRDSIDYYFKLRKINLGPCNKLYRKSLIVKMFPEDISLGEDTLFVLNYMLNVKKISVLDECLYNVVLDNTDSLNRKSKIDKFDLLFGQRKTEEEFLLELYGETCDMTEMYNCYLTFLHAHLLNMYFSEDSTKTEEMHEYIYNAFLQEKIKKSKPKRFDYILFKKIYIKRQFRMLKWYFSLKYIWYKRKEK